jgi:hypothetical protein
MVAYFEDDNDDDDDDEEDEETTMTAVAHAPVALDWHKSGPTYI